MSKNLKVIVSVTNDLYTDQRVHKVCTFLHENGYNVLLVGRRRKSSIPLPKRAYKTKRLRLIFEKGALFYAFFNFRLFLFLLFKRADILLANDLDTLLANYTASKFKKNVELVYDSHEYFTEVPELTSRPRVQNIWLRIERKIFPKLTTIYTVNHSIAAIYSDKYNKDIKVVRNISPLWKPEALKTKKELGIPEGRPLIILQGAGINIDRGGEEAVEAMVDIDAVLMIVGDGDVLDQLKSRVEELQLSEKVIFYGRKPYATMMNYTHFADIGLTLDKPTNMNYRLSLPNKVFDYMHTHTAIVATNLKEVTNVVQTHQIGDIIDELTVPNLVSCINHLLNDSDRLAQYKRNCIKAAEVDNWESESKILATIYSKNA
ncbi:MAG: glycosyltransferase family 4 protein [Crocinitomicaceae bacterium]|nr:glycosyltransferase family 4 protein [Crocinitomicaceae bacterium]